MTKIKPSEIRDQFDELAQMFPSLVLNEDSPNRWVIRGPINFSASYNEITLEDTYDILISIPSEYSDDTPQVQETGGRIPKEFHQFPDRTLCLGVAPEVRMIFGEHPRLLPFVKTLLVPYLFSHSHWQRTGEMPYDELSHDKGYVEYYFDYFGVDHEVTALALIRILVDDDYRGHHLCPCGSRRRLRECHGPSLRRLAKNQRPDMFLLSYRVLFRSLSGDITKIPKICRSKAIEKILSRAAFPSNETEKHPNANLKKPVGNQRSA